MSKSNTKKNLKKSKTKTNKTYKKKHYGKFKGGSTTMKGKDKKGGFSLWPLTGTGTSTGTSTPQNASSDSNIYNLYGLLKTPSKQERLDKLRKEQKDCEDKIQVQIDKVNNMTDQAPAPVVETPTPSTETTTMNQPAAPAPEQMQGQPMQGQPMQGQPMQGQPMQQQVTQGGRRRRKRKNN